VTVLSVDPGLLPIEPTKTVLSDSVDPATAEARVADRGQGRGPERSAAAQGGLAARSRNSRLPAGRSRPDGRGRLRYRPAWASRPPGPPLSTSGTGQRPGPPPARAAHSRRLPTWIT
jgi:hypothetical protein